MVNKWLMGLCGKAQKHFMCMRDHCNNLSESIMCFVVAAATWKLNLDEQWEWMQWTLPVCSQLPAWFSPFWLPLCMEEARTVQITLSRLLCQQVILVSFLLGVVAAATSLMVVMASWQLMVKQWPGDAGPYVPKTWELDRQPAGRVWRILPPGNCGRQNDPPQKVSMP